MAHGYKLTAHNPFLSMLLLRLALSQQQQHRTEQQQQQKSGNTPFCRCILESNRRKRESKKNETWKSKSKKHKTTATRHTMLEIKFPDSPASVHKKRQSQICQMYYQLPRNRTVLTCQSQTFKKSTPYASETILSLFPFTCSLRAVLSVAHGSRGVWVLASPDLLYSLNAICFHLGFLRGTLQTKLQ